MTTIPTTGRAAADLLDELRTRTAGDTKWREGRVFSLVYKVPGVAGEEHDKLLQKAHEIYGSTNLLNPMAFGSLKQMEREIIEMAAGLFHGPRSCVGTVTSGGTESILCAVAAYRDRARRRKPWILSPEIVVPMTIHPAFDKAAHYFGVKLVKVAVGPDLRADVRAMKKAISWRTIAIVASAPQYPHGVVDPIAELGRIAQKRGIPMHVDGCVGGFILPWLEQLGRPVPLWDFRVPGVTSISADLHKFAYAGKGASCLVWRSLDDMKHQIFVATDFPGGIYASPTMIGTRPGGPIAAAWTALQSIGVDGYKALAATAADAADRLRAGISATPGLALLGQSDSTIVSYAAIGADVYAIADRMEAKGWTIDRQHRPASIHLTVTANHAGIVDDYLADLRTALAEVRADPSLAKSGTAPMYGLAAKMPVRRLVASNVRKVIANMYAPGGESAVKRVAYARIQQETNALSPVETTIADFETAHYLVGADLYRATTEGPEVAGFFKRAELGGFVQAARARKNEIEPVPILSAWASSGGPLSTECFEALERRLVDGLKAAGPLDGVYLCLHGAMGARGIVDPETRLCRSVREALGNVPLVVSHDLHGNVTQARIDAVDALVAYQTNPHRDHAKIGKKAGAILIGTVLGEIRPTMAWRSLPMILGGGKTIDFLQPMRPVFKRMRAAEKTGEVLGASSFMVHPWNDSPALGWSTVVVTDNDPVAAERLADELAEMCWARRHEQPPAFPGASEAVAAARAATWRRKLGCVLISDASDVVTAGAPGDSTHLLRAFLDEGAGMTIYAAIRDPRAIGEMWPREPGDIVATTIGATLDPASSSPLPVRGSIVSKHERVGFGRTVVLAVEHVKIVITEGPSMVMRPSFYTEVGLDPWRADIVMVKNFFPFLMFFLPYNRKTIFVRTRGATDFDAAFQLSFDGPMHPRDTVDDWRERDQLRRSSPALAPQRAVT